MGILLGFLGEELLSRGLVLSALLRYRIWASVSVFLGFRVECFCFGCRVLVASALFRQFKAMFSSLAVSRFQSRPNLNHGPAQQPGTLIPKP